jgi:CBS domain-containing protein
MLIYGLIKFNPFLILIPLILLGSASAEEAAVRSRSALRNLRARHLLPQELASVDERTTMGEVLPLLLHSSQRHFPVMRGSRIAGVVSLPDLRREIAGPRGPDSPVSLAMRPAVIVGPDESLEDARKKMAAQGAVTACIAVRGRLEGMVSLEDLARLASLLEPGAGS